MEFPEEKFARQLYNEMSRQIVPRRSVQLSIQGGGVQWHCSISLVERSATVHCFTLSNETPEFLTFFRSSDQEIATARTSSMESTVRAVSQWLDSDDLTRLYESFPFVDHLKRRLLSIKQTVLQCAPALENGSELKYWGSGIYYLWLRNRTRSARISYYGKNEAPDVICHWDDCELFKFRGIDLQFLANVIKWWLCDETQPSEMRKEFPALSIGKLADYY